MAVSGTPWQLDCEKMEQRCGYLLTTGLWSDSIFMVGSDTNQEAIQAHKLVLAMASPVFEALFYGGLSERNDPIVSIPDVQPEAFRALLQYIYTGNVKIVSLDMAWNVLYGAKKYMLPLLEKECNTYICSVLGPKNACRAYECALFFDEKTLKDKCVEIISTNTKEVLKDQGFMDVELKTLITVCSLDHLNVDSELDLFHAVARYAEAEQRRQGQISPPVEGGPTEELSEKVLFPCVQSSSQSPAAELDSKPPTEVVTSQPTADKGNVKEEEPGIREAIKNIRFLSLSAQEFVESPARSGLLTEGETLAVLMNIVSEDSPVPMPTGFSERRERRQPRSDAKEQCFEAGSLEHTINALKRGDPSQVMEAVWAAVNILCNSTPRDIQPALEKGILDALVPALTEGSHACKELAARAIFYLCYNGSPAQLRVLAASAALQPYCHLLAATLGFTFSYVLWGLTNLLQKVEQNTKPDLLQKLRALGVPQLLIPLKQHYDLNNRQLVVSLLQTYFHNNQ